MLCTSLSTVEYEGGKEKSNTWIHFVDTLVEKKIKERVKFWRMRQVSEKDVQQKSSEPACEARTLSFLRIFPLNN
jgi:hypothetical protein